MRTISGTVGTREEAEAARRRLETLGIEGDRVLFKELDEPGRAASIFVTVKVAPEQVSAATDILNDAAAGAREPRPQPERDTAPAAPRIDPAASPARARVSGRDSGAPRVEPAVEHVERVERRTATPHPDAQAVRTRDRQPSAARIAAVGALLGGLGFAAGAALGIIF